MKILWICCKLLVSCQKPDHCKYLPPAVDHPPSASAVDMRIFDPSWPSAVCYWVSVVLDRLCSVSVGSEWRIKSRRLKISKPHSGEINKRVAEACCVQLHLRSTF